MPRFSDVCHCDRCEGRDDGTPYRDRELELLAQAYDGLDAYYADQMQTEHDMGVHDQQPVKPCRACFPTSTPPTPRPAPRPLDPDDDSPF